MEGDGDRKRKEQDTRHLGGIPFLYLTITTIPPPSLRRLLFLGLFDFLTFVVS